VFRRGQMGRSLKVLLIANLCLWIYFWIGFAHASHPPRSYPLRLDVVPPHGYIFWGHSIADWESPLVYPFYRIVFYTEFPSFLLHPPVVYFCHPDLPFTDLFTSLRAPYVILRGSFAGISTAGWMLLATMALSFLQWYFIGRVVQKLWRRLSKSPASALS
jgi:hypothetical protein